MANKFFTFLQHVGQDIEKGFEKAMPFIAPIESVLAMTPFGGIANATINTIISVEQKFAALGKQEGSGKDKMKEALAILEPILSQQLGHDGDKAKKFIELVVNFLNAIPAPPAQ